MRSRPFWVKGLSNAWHSRDGVSDELVDAYRLPQLVRGWEIGLVRFIRARVAGKHTLCYQCYKVFTSSSSIHKVDSKCMLTFSYIPCRFLLLSIAALPNSVKQQAMLWCFAVQPSQTQWLVFFGCRSAKARANIERCLQWNRSTDTDRTAGSCNCSAKHQGTWQNVSTVNHLVAACMAACKSVNLVACEQGCMFTGANLAWSWGSACACFQQ